MTIQPWCLFCAASLPHERHVTLAEAERLGLALTMVQDGKVSRHFTERRGRERGVNRLPEKKDRTE